MLPNQVTWPGANEWVYLYGMDGRTYDSTSGLCYYLHDWISYVRDVTPLFQVIILRPDFTCIVGNGLKWHHGSLDHHNFGGYWVAEWSKTGIFFGQNSFGHFSARNIAVFDHSPFIQWPYSEFESLVPRFYEVKWRPWQPGGHCLPRDIEMNPISMNAVRYHLTKWVPLFIMYGSINKDLILSCMKVFSDCSHSCLAA